MVDKLISALVCIIDTSKCTSLHPSSQKHKSAALNVILNERGYRDCENALGIQSLFEVGADGAAWAPFVLNAFKAKELFNKDIE